VKAIRHLTVSLLGLATLAACGHSNLVAAPTAKISSTHTIMAAGKVRKLGYDFTRYERTQASSARLQHFALRGAAPAQVDNRQFCAPVYDQGQLGSCTAFSMAKGLREYLQRSEKQDQVALSALWFYYNERKVDGDVGDDAGSTMTTGMNVLKDGGCATDVTWPYDITKFTDTPPSASDDTAAAWKVNTITQLATFDDMKAAVAAGNPVAIGFKVYESFEKIGANGIMPNPKSGEGILGGHAVLVVGYDDKKQYLTVRNSWSDTWGDKGYFYMPYKFAKDMNNHIMEAWTAN
jgi:C1A family cysteine protease